MRSRLSQLISQLISRPPLTRSSPPRLRLCSKATQQQRTPLSSLTPSLSAARPAPPSSSRQLHHHYTRSYSQDANSEKLDLKRLKSIFASPFPNKKTLPVEIDGDFIPLDNVFLRDACSCHLCVDPSTKQRLFQTSDIPKSIYSRHARVESDTGVLEVQWMVDGSNYSHRSKYSPEQLRLFKSLRSRIRARFNDQNYVLWDKAMMEKDVQFIDYEAYISNDEVLYFVLIMLSRYGLVFLKNVPDTPENNAVERIAERVGNIKHTFYGKTWDVKSIANSKNIAYTSLNLGLHMDLLYYESPPGLQFLHCIQNSATGGSSYFADSFRAAEWIRMNSPNAFTSLAQHPVTFHYKNDNQHYHYIRPTIVLDPYSYHQRKRIHHINYSPPFQAPFEIETGYPPPSAGFRQFLAGLQLFAGLVEDPKNQFELRLNPGECAIFQNRRALHARREFDPASGDRWLKGTYVDTDSFMSRLRVLSERHTRDRVEPEEDYGYIR